MPLIGNLIFAFIILLLLGAGIWAIAKKAWIMLPFPLLLLLLLWGLQRDTFLGRFEAAGTRIDAYFVGSDEGFVRAEVSGKAGSRFKDDVLMGFGGGDYAKLKAYHSPTANAIWVFTTFERNLTKQPAVFNLKDGDSFGAKTMPPTPSPDAVELPLLK